MKNLPAGLLPYDNRFELFNDGKDLDQCYCSFAGVTYRVSMAPVAIQTIIVDDMAKHFYKVHLLYNMGFDSYPTLIEKYCSCLFGAYDGQPDSVDGELLHAEYWQCPERHSCPGYGIVCNPLRVAHGVLTERQVDVLELVGQCLIEKEIAHHLGISIETVKIHKRDIRHKAGLSNSMDLVLLAKQNNL